MKAYVAPKSVVLSMNMKENIAASKFGINEYNEYRLIDGVVQDTGYEYNGETGEAFRKAFGAYLLGLYGDQLLYTEYDSYLTACKL